MAITENVWAWSTAAASNATVDSAINWAEGQDPATVNNSARAMMAAGKRMANVQSGNVTAGNVGNAYTVTTGQTIEAAQQALGFRICFKATATNTGAATMAVDALSAVAIQRPNGDALSAGDIVLNAFHDIAFDGTNYKLLVPGAGGNYGSLSGGNTWTGSNIFQAGATVGDDSADPVVIKGTTVSAFGAGMLGASSQSAWQGALAMGTAALQNTGTSGATVPLLNGSNTWSTTNNFTAGIIASNSTNYPSQFNKTSALVGEGITVYLVNSFTSGSVTVASASSVQFNTTSDYRLKHEIEPLDPAPVIDQLRPIKFKWKADQVQSVGFLAHELADLIPGAVVGAKDAVNQNGSIAAQGADITKLIPYLVAEIKALRARVAALEAASP